MRGIPALPLLVLFASSCPAATLCVRQNAPGPLSDGTSWASAYATVQSALSAASPGDEVWVAAGTYKENITLPSGVALYGGFTGTETSREQRDPQKNASILDGQGNGKTVVTIAADATSATILDGFTVQNSYVFAQYSQPSYGGGIYIAGGTPVISHNTIQDCYAVGANQTASFGGGIYVDAGMPLISYNTLQRNAAVIGGGIYANGGLIRDNLITNNAAWPSYNTLAAGGGLAIANVVAVHNSIIGNQGMGGVQPGMAGGAFCQNCVFLDNFLLDNTARYDVALDCAGTDTVLRNTILFTQQITTTLPLDNQVDFGEGTFADNLIVSRSTDTCLTLGFGTRGIPDSHPVIANNTIINVGTPMSSGVVSLYRTGEQATLSNNIITGWQYAGGDGDRGGTPPVFTVDHNDCYGNGDNTLVFPGTSSNNISSDPLFVDPAKGDYHLKAGSPCIDAGNDAVVKSWDRDQDGAPRIAGAHVDIGCFEYGSPLYTVQDAATVLRIAAGISLSTPADASRLDVAGETGLTVTDATRIAQWLLN